VPTVTPTTEIPEMMLMMLCDFFEKRYRRAIKNGNLLMANFLNVNYILSLFLQRAKSKAESAVESRQLAVAR
jgi:hypothetical protein